MHMLTCVHIMCIQQEREMDLQTELCLQSYQRPGQPLLGRSRRKSQSLSNTEPKGVSMHCYRLSPG